MYFAVRFLETGKLAVLESWHVALDVVADDARNRCAPRLR